MKKISLLIFISIQFIFATQAQYNCQLLGKRTYTGMNLSGSWGWNDLVNNKEYALVGTTKGLSIVDITTPTTPVEVKFIPGSQGLWRECQTWKNHAYITQDNNINANSEGVLIYDLTTLPGGKVDTFKSGGGNDTILKTHSLYIDDSGFLYLNGGRTVINGVNNNGKVNINGSYDINVWYAYENNTKTNVIARTFNYNDTVNVKLKNEEGLTDTNEIIVRSLTAPQVRDVKADNNVINLTVEKELGVEIVGDTKVRINVEEDYDDYDEDEEPEQISVTEDYLNGVNQK